MALRFAITINKLYVSVVLEATISSLSYVVLV